MYGVSTVPVAFASSEIGSRLKGDNKRHHGGQQCKMETQPHYRSEKQDQNPPPSPPPLSPWQQEVRTRLKVNWLERGSTLHLPPNGFITAGPGPKAPAWDGGGGCWEEDVVMNTIILTQVDKIYTVSPSLILCGMFADLGG